MTIFMIISMSPCSYTMHWEMMPMSDYQRLLSNFEALGLNNMREYYPVLLDKVHTEDMSLTSAFLELTDKEMTFQKEKKVERAIHRARFPKVKTFDTFNFDFQPGLNRKEVLELKHLGFNSRTSFRFKPGDRKSTRLNSSHVSISYAVFCLTKKR